MVGEHNGVVVFHEMLTSLIVRFGRTGVFSAYILDGRTWSFVPASPSNSSAKRTSFINPTLRPFPNHHNMSC